MPLVAHALINRPSMGVGVLFRILISMKWRLRSRARVTFSIWMSPPGIASLRLISRDKNLGLGLALFRKTGLFEPQNTFTTSSCRPLALAFKKAAAELTFERVLESGYERGWWGREEEGLGASKLDSFLWCVNGHVKVWRTRTNTARTCSARLEYSTRILGC